MIALDYRLFSDEDYDELWHSMVRINSSLKELRQAMRISDVTESNYRFHVCKEGPILCDSIAAQSKQAKYLRLVAATPLKSNEGSQDRTPPMNPGSKVVAKEIDSPEPKGDSLSLDNLPSQVEFSLESLKQEMGIESETLTEIKDCLPQNAVAHFITLRNIKDESETQKYQQRLADSRRNAAARGLGQGSGAQLSQEWQIIRETQEARALGYIEAALETCKLYEIPLTQQLCDCLLQAIHNLLEVQHKHARQTISLRISSIDAPATLRSHFENQPAAFPVWNRIRAMVETARVQDQKARIAMTREKNNVGSTYHQTIHQYGGVMNATQTGNVNVQHLTTDQLNALEPELATVRAALRTHGSLEADEGVGLLAGAEKAAKEGNEGKMLSFLKQIPAKAWDVGKDVLSGALQAYLRAHGIIP